MTPSPCLPGDTTSQAAEDETPAKAYLTTGSPASSGPATPTHTAVKGKQRDGEGQGEQGASLPEEEVEETGEKMSSALPTMWMGGQSGR